MHLIVLRHGATSWNAEGRLQGQADPPLSADGRRALEEWVVPAAWRRLPCWVSPLRRARETAEILGWRDPEVLPVLIEMDWGRFEGRTLADLRAELGETLARNEARGLDFRPPGGESPREVMQRLQRWIDGLPAADGDALVVTHKGVRRALLALATGWDMRCPPPVRLRDHEALRLHHDGPGHLVVIDTVSLEPRQ
jgi:broad specificity phosphatase PhoE